jgi:O-Antigen ligase
MTPQRMSLTVRRASPRLQDPPGAWAIVTLLFAVAVAAALRDGAFWPDQARLAAIASLLLLAAALVMQRPDRRTALVLGALVVLGAWWLLRAGTTGSFGSFLPLGASIGAFAAAYGSVRLLSGSARDGAALAMVGLGAGCALLGLVGLTWRITPLALPAQGLWRMSSTVTYADAAGVVCAVCLLLALGCDRYPVFLRAAVCLTSAGLLASQSRGAILACVCAGLLVPWRRYTRFSVALIAGLALGVTAVATSPDSDAVPLLGLTVLAAVLVASIDWQNAAWWQMVKRGRLVVAAAAVCAAAVVTAIVHHELALRALAPSDGDRAAEWAAALHQWASSPLVGVGPDRTLLLQAGGGSTAHFVHNEYLQVAADGGIVGLGILGVVAYSLMRVVARFDALATSSLAALVCFAIAGAFDFDWHLPIIGLLGGWCAGLAARRTAEV